ncbi:MAG TPA: chorismate mutase [Terriglobia bacterium]|nr:chorismate mutase [Terriglobia bacterium]
MGNPVMDLADWRSKIDAIDRELVRLLNERARCVAEIGRIKLQNGMPVEASGREEKVFENVRNANQGPLGEEELRRVFERIIEEGKALQRRLRQQEVSRQK